MFKNKKKQSNDQLMILTAVLLLILSLGVILSSGKKNKDNSDASRVLSPKIIGSASITIDFGNGKRRAFEGSIVENETLIDILNQAARAGEFSYRLTKKNDLASLGELVSSDKKSWRWYLNGKRVNKKPNEVSVKSGDKVLIKYE